MCLRRRVSQFEKNAICALSLLLSMFAAALSRDVLWYCPDDNDDFICVTLEYAFSTHTHTRFGISSLRYKKWCHSNENYQCSYFYVTTTMIRHTQSCMSIAIAIDDDIKFCSLNSMTTLKDSHALRTKYLAVAETFYMCGWKISWTHSMPVVRYLFVCCCCFSHSVANRLGGDTWTSSKGKKDMECVELNTL